MSKIEKCFEIVVTKLGADSCRTSGFTVYEGTLAELIKTFKYTLETGKSYEREKGNKKINTEPKGIASLVKNIQNAKDNAALHGYSRCSVDYKVL